MSSSPFLAREKAKLPSLTLAEEVFRLDRSSWIEDEVVAGRRERIHTAV